MNGVFEVPFETLKAEGNVQWYLPIGFIFMNMLYYF